MRSQPAGHCQRLPMRTGHAKVDAAHASLRRAWQLPHSPGPLAPSNGADGSVDVQARGSDALA
jgi:hypothetical protein